jgi:hypothetical protein
MNRFVPITLLFIFAACGGGGTPTASPSATHTSLPPIITTTPPETAKSVFCGHVTAHVNNLLNIIANPSTEDDFGIEQMQDQIDEFREDAKQKEDPEVAKLAKDFISALQDLVDATETDGLQAALQQHGEAFLDAIGNATTFCA